MMSQALVGIADVREEPPRLHPCVCVLLGAACHSHRTLLVAKKINQKMSLSSSAKYLLQLLCQTALHLLAISTLREDPSRVRHIHPASGSRYCHYVPHSTISQ